MITKMIFPIRSIGTSKNGAKIYHFDQHYEIRLSDSTDERVCLSVVDLLDNGCQGA